MRYRAKKHYLFICVIACLILLAGCAPEPPDALTPILKNGGFEGAQAPCPAIWWDSDGDVHVQTFGNIFCPYAWTPYWLDGWPCAGDLSRVTGQPEVRVIGANPDPLRILQGSQAVEWFTFHRCHSGGLVQAVTLTPGRYYRLCGSAHAFYTNCSDMPHSAPRDWGPACLPIPWVWDALRVGLSTIPNPNSPEVVWSQPEYIYGVYGDETCTPPVEAKAWQYFAILHSDASHALRHCNVYWDAVELVEVYPVWLPIITQGAR